MDLLTDIQTWVTEEIQKGIQYPVTGKLGGKLVSKIMKKIGKEKRLEHYVDTGRLVLFDEQKSEIQDTTYTTDPRETQEALSADGYLGSNWCPNDLDEALFIETYNDAVETGREVYLFSRYISIVFQGLAYMIDLYLWDGYGPDGATRAQPPTGFFGSRQPEESDWWLNDEDN